MKSFRAFFRSVRDAFKSVGRNFSLSLASVSCITITLIIISSAILFSRNVENFANEIKQDVTIVAFLNSDVLEEERKVFESEIKKLDNVETYEFKSKREVKDAMAKDYDELSDILADWDDETNPLQDTYTIKVIDVNKISKTAKSIKKLDNVNSVQYGEGLVEKLVKTFNTIEKITIIAAGSLIIVTIFLIINTIKLTIFSRKKEISIMRLVGASNGRIKLPFIVEGIFLGIIGAVIPTIFTIYGYTTLYNKNNGVLFSPIIKLVKPTPFVFEVSMIILIIGVVVGMFGSARAVRRYINQ